MAGLVLVVIAVTSWRVVARDLAALHLSGVPLAILRRALLGEQLALVLVGVAVGVLCGALTSALAMPLLPLFDVPAEVPALQLEPSWQAIALAAVASTTALVAIGAGGDRGGAHGRAAPGQGGAVTTTWTASRPGTHGPAPSGTGGLVVSTHGLVHIYRAEGHDVAALSESTS